MQRIKVMAGLDIAERRKPQTGRIELCVSDQRYSLLVSTAPTVDGECCILRIVPGKAGQTRLDQVCLEDTGLAVVRKWLERSHGLILVSGPTGSGKTTTLHAMVNEVKGPEKVIMGVECPVSARLDGVSHLLVRPEAGFGFPQAIRTAVSQICDVIFVSDLPDAETVEAACHAASAGCLVLACAAADSAPATITRLLQTGCRPQLLAAALIGVTNQRLIRKVCGSCREETALDSLSPAEREFIGAFQIEKPCRGKGCEQCNNTGYRWRVAVYELLEVNDALSEAIAGQRPSRELMEIAVRSGMKRLRESGLAKVSEGVTTVGELLRVLARLPDGR
jgi:type IV pilus assembly protein PilB